MMQMATTNGKLGQRPEHKVCQNPHKLKILF
jgi:hypothetical protein